MSFRAGPIYTTCGTKCECISENAHADLYSLEKLQSEDTTRKRGSKNFSNLLRDLAALESDCWRFFYKTYKKLSGVTSELRAKHTHYWDTWGKVVGGVLSAEFEPEESPFDAWMILSPRVHEFAEGDWKLRSFLIRAFRGVGRQCAQWDDSLERALECYYAFCWATASVLRRKPPKALGDSIGWLLEVWYLIAEKCDEERHKLLQGKLSEEEAARKRTEIEKTVCKIIGAAFPLLRLIDRMSDLNSDRIMEFWIPWMQMLFDHTLSDNKLTITEKMRKELKDFRTKCDKFLNDVKDVSNKRRYHKQLQKCDVILADFEKTWGNN